ncbi:rhomboid family intramembrane serine protease [Sphingomicrobium sp. XHP0239]|uniref:rhomboid family intramembrane serine protease n=1 Tax=Sphingomicrobium maritimum TaxID=3133972 RepID=UPI0031CCCBD6
MALLRSATGVIAVLTAIVFVLVLVLIGEGRAFVLGGFIPARVAGLIPLPDAIPAFLTPLTAALLHAGFAHLAFNLVILLYCGFQLERLVGAGQFVLLYIVGAYGAAAAQWLLDPVAAVPMVGASGAVSAVVGAFAVRFGKAKRVTGSRNVDRAIHVIWLLAAWVVLQLMVDWMGTMDGTLIATPAHIGGFVVGLLANGFLRVEGGPRHAL